MEKPKFQSFEFHYPDVDLSEFLHDNLMGGVVTNQILEDDNTGIYEIDVITDSQEGNYTGKTEFGEFKFKLNRKGKSLNVTSFDSTIIFTGKDIGNLKNKHVIFEDIKYVQS